MQVNADVAEQVLAAPPPDRKTHRASDFRRPVCAIAARHSCASLSPTMATTTSVPVIRSTALSAMTCPSRRMALRTQTAMISSSMQLKYGSPTPRAFRSRIVPCKRSTPGTTSQPVGSSIRRTLASTARALVISTSFCLTADRVPNIASGSRSIPRCARRSATSRACRLRSIRPVCRRSAPRPGSPRLTRRCPARGSGKTDRWRGCR
jgi:hypothetical protein